MTFPAQKSFGEFIAERIGPKWVYAAQRSKRIAAQYPGSVVVLPAQQRELAVLYKREWGEEYNPAMWMALCALRETSKQVDFCGFDAATKTMVLDAIEAMTGSAT